MGTDKGNSKVINQVCHSGRHTEPHKDKSFKKREKKQSENPDSLIDKENRI
jgi:hypothetical protein